MADREVDPGLTCVGAIAGGFGVQGEVRLKSFCADPAAIAGYAPLVTEDGRSFGVSSPRPSPAPSPRGSPASPPARRPRR